MVIRDTPGGFRQPGVVDLHFELWASQRDGRPFTLGIIAHYALPDHVLAGRRGRNRSRVSLGVARGSDGAAEKRINHCARECFEKCEK